MQKADFTKDLVHHMAKLCNLTPTSADIEKLYASFLETFDYIEVLDELDISTVSQTNQVTGLTNIFFSDSIDHTNSLSPEQALSNALDVTNAMFSLGQIRSKE